MPNSGQNDQHVVSDSERTAQMQERVRSLGVELTNVSTQFNGRLTEFATSVSGKFNEVTTALSSLSNKLEDRGRAPWNLLLAGGGFFVSIFTVVGFLVYTPIRESIARQDMVVTKIADVLVTQREFGTYATVQDGRFARLENAIDDQRKMVVPRGEHEEKWSSQRTRDADIQRQLDELRNTLSGIYSPKDELSRLERKVDELEGLATRK